MGDDLVPLIGKNNVDAMSKRLTDYIKNGLRIFADQSDGYALAQALGLKVVFIPFDASGNILGKLLFEGTDMDIILNGSKQKAHFDFCIWIKNPSFHTISSILMSERY